MRKVSVFSNPVAEPGVCGKCGSQDKDWFIDAGFDVDFNIQAGENQPSYWLDGVLYLCCDCLNNLITDARKQFDHYLKDHDVEVYLNGSERDASEVSNGSSETAEPDDSGTSDKSSFVPSLAVGFGHSPSN